MSSQTRWGKWTRCSGTHESVMSYSVSEMSPYICFQDRRLEHKPWLWGSGPHAKELQWGEARRKVLGHSESWDRKGAGGLGSHLLFTPSCFVSFKHKNTFANKRSHVMLITYSWPQDATEYKNLPLIQGTWSAIKNWIVSFRWWHKTVQRREY